MKAMILAAGFGSRLKPITDDIPKAMVTVAGSPIILTLLKNLSNKGIKDFIINLHHHSKILHQFLELNKPAGLNIYYSDESDQLLDTGGAIKKASHFFSDGNPFLIHNVDILTELDPFVLLKNHNRTKSIATLAVRERETSRYFIFNNKLHLCGWENIIEGNRILVNKTDNDLLMLAYSGISIISPEIFSYFPAKNRFSFIELILAACKHCAITGYRHDDGYWYDLGKLERIKEAESDNKIKSINS